MNTINLIKHALDGITHAELCRRSGIAEAHLCRLLKGQAPTVTTLQKIGMAVGKKLVLSWEE